MDPFQKYSIMQVATDSEAATAGYKFITAPPISQIQDARGLQDFKQFTLGGHKRQDALSGLDKSLGQGQIEMACYWAIQLLCSGAATQLWDRLMLYAVKQINIGCPRLPQWIASKARCWQRMLAGKKEFIKAGILHVRNLQQFRNIIVEMVVVLCQARKRKLDTGSVKITDQDFIVATFTNKCVARKTNYLDGLVGANDTREIIIAANEFYHHLLNKDIDHTIYWLQWILHWEKQNIKRFKSFQVQARQIEGISDAHQRDVIWLIWSIFHQVRQRMLSSTRQQSLATGMGNTSTITGQQQLTLLEMQLNSLWDMYIQDWKPGAKARKLPLLIWSIQYLVYPLDWTIPVIPNLGTFVKASASINRMFTKIAQTQCTSYMPPGSQHPGSTIDTVIQNNYIPLGPSSLSTANPIKLDGMPPLQVNTQRMIPHAPTYQSEIRPTTLQSSAQKQIARKGGAARQLTDDEKAKMGWMTMVLQ